MRGDSDPYVLADPVHRSLSFAPHGQFVALRGVGHYGHEEDPGTVNEHLGSFIGRR
ncbi:Possible epoxide hydrolase EphE [Mycobacteroides abscessus subsp. massiliense]|jgi:pimeloyl-ACP methyl ester carboxylesterase|nr:Possible epoxide hydrolase EphE [Mycobacteroides abscessus subsp. massiliense]